MEKDGELVLGSDKFLFDTINEIKSDFELFESMSADPSQKLTKPQQRERDKSLSSDSMEEGNEEFSVKEIEACRSLQRARPDAGGSSSEISNSSLGLSVPQKIHLPEAPGMYYSWACTRQAIAFPIRSCSILVSAQKLVWEPSAVSIMLGVSSLGWQGAMKMRCI
jgi:hypothetical protein